MNTVEVRNAFKQYGKGKDHKIILNKLNMTVPPGSIYGLMGASGCGKTTLLSCIIGMIPLDEGEINVFGSRTTKYTTKVASRRIGYMPQETALIGELTIKETIYYFGKIFEMDIDKLRERYDMLHKLLELPYGDKRVEECSGGQMRRISFAAAMIHEPDLLILDEPTVGLDPLLREKIWNFMMNITRTSKLAVIITTHYIEEAKQADCCGLMRNGILLAEDRPINIINRLGVENLEEAFLKLCIKHGTSDEAEESISIQNSNNIQTNNNNCNEIEMKQQEETLSANNNIDAIEETEKSKIKRVRWQIVWALLVKNFLQLKRQPGAVLFLTFLPVVQLFLFNFTIGGNPKGLKIGIVDDEIISYSECNEKHLISTLIHDDYTCELNLISCRFLNEITDDIAIKVFYSSFDEAYKDAKRAKLNGIIQFNANFTEALDEVRNNHEEVSKTTRDNSRIKVYLDQTDLQLTFFLQRRLYDVYKNYSQNVLTDCQMPKKLDNIPIDFEKPIYGSYQSDFKHSMFPPFTMIMIFGVSSALTIGALIAERREGFWNRTLLAGVSTLEIMVAHTIINISILIVQLLEILLLLAFTFETHTHGSYFIVSLMMSLLGCCGLFFGLWVSCFCTDFMQANLLMTGVTQPMIVLSGMFWPIEGMPLIVRLISYSTPTTWPSLSMRDIIEKGYPISHPTVLIGFGILITWVILSVLLGLRTLEKHKFSRNT